MAFSHKVICPICGSDQYEHLYTISIAYALMHGTDVLPESAKQEMEAEMLKIWGPEGSVFIRCICCDFNFASPFKAGTQEFYALLYSNMVAYPEWKWEYQVAYEMISNIIDRTPGKEARLLDLGAGNGSFVIKVASDLIRKDNILCTEYSQDGAEYIQSQGIKCISDDFRNLPLDKYHNAFDIICLFQVLEHLDNLDDFLKGINQLAAKDAHLFVAVPNYFYRRFYDGFKIYLDVPPIHLSRWKQSDLVRFFDKHDWSMVSHHIQPMAYFLKLRKFLFYLFNRMSVSMWAGKVRNRILNQILKGMVFVFLCIIYVPSIIRLGSSNMGISQLIIFKRKHIES